MDDANSDDLTSSLYDCSADDALHENERGFIKTGEEELAVRYGVSRQ